MYVPVGQPFTATLINPSGLGGVRLGARIEIPVTRAIVGYWRPATLSGAIWSVELEAPPAEPERPPELGDDPFLREALKAGAFQIVWRDGGPEPPQVEIFVPPFTFAPPGAGWGGSPWPPPDLEAITPDVDDVAALLRTRTYEDGVVEFATFTDDTRPPAAEVERLIARAVPVVLSQLRPTFPESLYGEVSHAICLYTAILIEGSYFREQINESQVALYRDLYTDVTGGITSQIEMLLEDIFAGGALRLV